MLCARFLRRGIGVAHEEGDTPGMAEPAEAAPAATGPMGSMRRALDRFFHGMNVNYERLLRAALQRRGLVLALSLVVVASIGVLFRFLPSELVPIEDRGFIFNVISAPEGSTLEYTDRYVRRVEAIYQNVPEVETMFTAVGLGFGGPGRTTDAFMFVRLKPRHERQRSQMQVVTGVFPMMMTIPGSWPSPSISRASASASAGPCRSCSRPRVTTSCSAPWAS
jgi:multidrug efflux pump subunit AcrB